MTSKKLALYTLYQFVILALLKVWFFNTVIFSNAGIQQIVFWIIVIIIGAALVRRFEVINFFESFFIIFIWVVGDAFFDLLITSRFTGLSIFAGQEYWVGAFFLGLSVFLFHKKRHLQVRHELHAKAHAAAHPHSNHQDNHHKH